MANQGLLFSKLSIVETGIGCFLYEVINPPECAIFIGALSPEEFDRMIRNYAEC